VLEEDAIYRKACYLAGQASMRWQSQTKLALARGDAATQFPRGLVYLQQSGPAEAGTLCEEGVAAQPEHAMPNTSMGKY